MHIAPDILCETQPADRRFEMIAVFVLELRPAKKVARDQPKMTVATV